MCGRLACALSPQEICNACCYQRSSERNYSVPEWKDCYNSGKSYKQSYNVCPTDVAPILLSGNHFNSGNSRLIAPMVFGLIPSWGPVYFRLYYSLKSGRFNTINCRIETIKTSKLYGALLKKGQRCVVICNGFYEWKKEKNSSKPYFCHVEQPEGILVDDPNTWNLKFAPETGYSGFKPLKLAALFETNSNSLEEATLSFTIITKEASSETSWLHSRIPAILKTDDQLDAWLNHEEVNADLALSYISENASLVFCQVSNKVNTVTNKDISCIKNEKDPAQVENKQGSGSFLMNWLKQGQKRKSSSTMDDVCEKIKKENN